MTKEEKKKEEEEKEENIATQRQNASYENVMCK